MRRAIVIAGLGLCALLSPPAVAQRWEVLRPASVEANVEVQWEVTGDGSLLIAPVAGIERCRIECPTELEGIQAIRLEVLPHASLPKQGPGMAPNGDFLLSELRLESVVGHKGRGVVIEAAAVSYAKLGRPVSASFDGRADSGWAVGEKAGVRSEAVFHLAKPLGRGLRTLAFDLDFAGAQAIGHLRLSVTDEERPTVEQDVDVGRGKMQEAVDDAVGRGVEYLLGEQELDGSWAAEQSHYKSGCTALVVYALVKSGVDPKHQAIQRALAYLAAHPPEKTYEAGCHLMAYAALGEPERWRDLSQAVLDELLSWQVGDWGYPGSHADPMAGHRDLSNTQYGALGLWAATKLGLEVPAHSWETLAERVLLYQKRGKGGGGFSYGPGGANPTGSMSAAGIAVLALCEPHLSGSQRDEVVDALQLGLEWMEANFSPTNNPGGGAWFAYYLYGVERVGAFTDTDVFNGQEWYKEGARALIKAQNDKGAWADAARLHPTTCFSLLFMNRATSSTTGPGARKNGSTYGEDDPEVDISLRAAGDTPMTFWISSYGEGLLDGYTFDGEREHGPRVARVEYLTPGATVLSDSRSGGSEWRYSTRTPDEGWQTADFEPKGWKTGRGGFGRPDSPQLVVGTPWDDSDLWLVQDVEVEFGKLVEPRLVVSSSIARATVGPQGELLKLYDEEPELAQVLGGGADSAIEHVDGGGARGKGYLRVSGGRRAKLRIPAWAFAIRETPRVGEYRYLQFAWRNEDADGVSVQLALNGAWSKAASYLAGDPPAGATAVQVERKAPKNWNVVTRDLWDDVGKEGLLTGLAVAPIGAGVAGVDEIYLARSKADLKRIARLRDEPPEWAGEQPHEPHEPHEANEDDGALTVWINGEVAAVVDGETAGFAAVLEGDALIDMLRPGRNRIAVHARNSDEGRAVDLGLTDDRVLVQIAGDAEAPARGERFPARVRFGRPGIYDVWARVFLTDEATGDLAVFESNPIAVNVREVLSPDMLEYASDASRNLLASAEPEVRASSEMGGWPATNAVDNAQSTGWLCTDGDPTPSLRIQLRRPVRADSIVFSHTRADRRDANRTNVPTRVSVVLNGKGDPIVLELSPDRLQKSRISFEKPVKLRSFEVRILDQTPAKNPGLTAVGFAEVELQLSGRR